MTTVAAAVGPAYEISHTASGLIKLARDLNGRYVYFVFSPAEALAVADALVDAVEHLPQ